ncbi:hypothetical protein W97_03026 [Coniosporium apollinis CBS 100218]|uniref:Altered inheritance of mitochondria protein 24, mitochondrial n=1 Tax=Coniosporium apollinis (strain CBS 100218) TaxID=1168221 RepID=R7YPL9_CONA1|nr:uncharacterized protein W97_03026 [Coniosporium apollinis CBS 100218]EON63798.1 hypothetical protein W97_03026 [Coniosporium apollinis CBS 100218]
MRRSAAKSIWSAPCSTRSSCVSRIHSVEPIGRRPVSINAAPASSSPSFELDPAPQPTASPGSSTSPDARFEVIGSPYSLLSVSLSASQNLYTRRGTLVGLSGKAENAVSTLSILEPFRRALVGIPFLYQRISSTTPVTALISSKSPITSFAVVHLDGRLDWIVAQRSALLAWTGHALSVKPRINTSMSLAHWGNSQVTGRGLLGLVGTGQIYQIHLKSGEEYVVHPSNVVAYTMTQHPPQPYRFKSALRLQIPGFRLGALVPDTKFFREMARTGTWQAISNFFFTIRTWARRSIWGDRLFLQFHGPSTILLQSRGSRLSDSLSRRDVAEIADAPAGAADEAVTLSMRKESGHGSSMSGSAPANEQKTRVSYATVESGKVDFKSS